MFVLTHEAQPLDVNRRETGVCVKPVAALSADSCPAPIRCSEEARPFRERQVGPDTYPAEAPKSP